jgi:hypothetical protein
MIGFHVKPKEDLDRQSLFTLTESELLVSGINTILYILVKKIRLLKQFKVINSIYFIQICTTNKKPRSITYKIQMILIIVSLNLKLDLLIRILLLKF